MNPQWEYRISYIDARPNVAEEELNALGKDGRELVQIKYGADDSRKLLVSCIFKRLSKEYLSTQDKMFAEKASRMLAREMAR